MPIAQRSFQEFYDLFRGELQRPGGLPDTDFNEGAFYDLFAGAISMVCGEVQAYAFERFAKTFLQPSANAGTELEAWAVDKFGDGAARPAASAAVGTIRITRGSSPVNITVSVGDRFNSGDLQFQALQETTSLAAQSHFDIAVQAVQPGKSGNIGASAGNWKTAIPNVTIDNATSFQGGAAILNDSEYKVFLLNFILSLQSGTKEGIEASARLIPGVFFAHLERSLLPVGRLNDQGALIAAGQTGHALFNTIVPKLYVFGETQAPNTALLALIKQRLDPTLSAGESLPYAAARPTEVPIDLTLTFTTADEALALSQNKTQIEEAIKKYFSSLAIGQNFVRATFISNLQSQQDWSGLFTGVVNAPTGDITAAADVKLVAGDITIRTA